MQPYMSQEINYNSAILDWAITRAGTSVEKLVKSFPKLPDWISKKAHPTVKQLEKLSHTLHVPFGFLFLDSPPAETIPFPFFRTTGNTNAKISLNLYDTILLNQRRQDWLRDYLRENGAERLDYVGLFNGKSRPEVIIKEIRKRLDMQEEWAADFSTIEESVNFLTERIEELGVIVIFNGVVENSNGRALPVEECRGFVLVDPYAPLMFVNNADGKAAQLFTLLHELVHVFIGQSAGFDNGKLLPADDPIEQLCDQVAAEFLVPAVTLLELWKVDPGINRLARHFKVSRIVVARRALDLGKITKTEFFRLYAAYRTEIQHKKDIASNGGNFYATQKKRVSIRFAGLVDQAVKTEQLLYRDAYKLTGLKGDTYSKFMAKYFA
jgi:Zn-dependent peptidase ImmA (M78 family)